MNNKDYDKLKLAHELAEKLDKYYFTFSGYSTSGLENIYLLHPNKYDGDSLSIDELIAKLQSLLKPEPKYEVGSIWWYLDEADFIMHPKPKSFTITENNQNWYRADEEWFPTRQALIEHQIGYWAKMEKDLCPDSYMPERYIDYYIDDKPVTEKPCDNVGTECQHESDGTCEGVLISGRLKCIKCGEMYR